jgi:hypothetical protein
MNRKPVLGTEHALLPLLPLLWGLSYPIIKVAVAEITPVTLIGARVIGASPLSTCRHFCHLTVTQSDLYGARS